MFLDASFPTSYPWFTNPPPLYPGAKFNSGANGGGMGVFCLPRHNNAINGAFIDRSVRRIELKELWILKWCRNYSVPRARQSEPIWADGTGWMVPLPDADFIRED